MPSVLALDISTNAGWALLVQDPDLAWLPIRCGLIEKEKAAYEYGPYPGSYRQAALFISNQLTALIAETDPDVVVVEETNQNRGGNVYSQKLLEWIHGYLGLWWELSEPRRQKLVYIRTSHWKHALGLKKPKTAEKNDRLLKKAKELAATGVLTLNEAKKKVGVRGKWNKKMLAVDFVNENFGLEMKLVDNDLAEAICLGLAYTRGAPLCTGVPDHAREG